MESVLKFKTYEQARNAAIKWLEARAVKFGPERKVEIGRLQSSVNLFGKEVGVSGDDPFWRLRLDEDPTKGPHFNAEFGKGSNREKAAFCFEATDQIMKRLGSKRKPR